MFFENFNNSTKRTIYLILFFLFSVQTFSQNRVEVLKQKITQLKEKDKNYINAFNDLSFELYKNTPDSSKVYAEIALQLSKKQNYKKGIADSEKNLGLAAQIKGESSSALKLLILASNEFEALSDTLGLVECYNGLGKVYYNKGNVDKALEIFLKGLKLSEKLSDPRTRANTLDNMGIIYLAQHNIIAALDYFFQAIDIREKNQDKAGITLSCNNIAMLYTEKKDFKRAINYYNEALVTGKEIGDNYSILNSYYNLGLLYFQQKQYTEALNCFENSVKVATMLGNETQLANSLISIGNVYFNQNDLKKSFGFHQKALTLAKQSANPEILKKAYLSIYQDYKNMEQDKSALSYFEHYIYLRDSLNNKKTSEKIASLQEVYEKNKRENEIYGLRSQNITNQKIALENDAQRNFLIISVFLLLCLTGLLIFINSKRKLAFTALGMQNVEVNRQKEELALQKEEIDKKNKELEELNNTKDKFFSIIAHDLKSPIASFAAFTEVLTNYYEDLSSEEVKFIASDLSQSVNNLNQLTDNLLTWARLQMRMVEPEPKNLSLKPIIEEIVIQLNQIAETKHIQIQVEPYDHSVYADENYLRFALRNFISNAIKFTNPGGGIIVGTRKKNRMIHVSVSDTGIGMKEEVLKTIFDPNVKKNFRGTAGEKGTGLGLILCKEFVEKSGGQIWVVSQEGKGSIFTFSLKLAMPDNFQELLSFMRGKEPQV